jgi:hypothetical protein
MRPNWLIMDEAISEPMVAPPADADRCICCAPCRTMRSASRIPCVKPVLSARVLATTLAAAPCPNGI